MSFTDENFLLTVSRGGNTVMKRWITIEQRVMLGKWFDHISIEQLRSDASIEKITATCCLHFKVEESLLYTRTRKSEVKNCRQMCMYFIHRHLKHSSAYAGKIFGRDHATVLHAVRVVETKMSRDRDLIIGWLGLKGDAPETDAAPPAEKNQEPVHA